MNLKLALPIVACTMAGGVVAAQGYAADTPTKPEGGYAASIVAAHQQPCNVGVSGDYISLFYNAQFEGDYHKAIGILRDWDHVLLLQDKAEARLEVAYHAFQLGRERHAAHDHDNAAMLLGHAIDIHREMGGAHIYAIWTELARLHIAQQRPAFARLYIDRASRRLAFDGGAASSATHDIFAMKERLLINLQHQRQEDKT